MTEEKRARVWSEVAKQLPRKVETVPVVTEKAEAVKRRVWKVNRDSQRKEQPNYVKCKPTAPCNQRRDE